MSGTLNWIQVRAFIRDVFRFSPVGIEHLLVYIIPYISLIWRGKIASRSNYSVDLVKMDSLKVSRPAVQVIAYRIKKMRTDLINVYHVGRNKPKNLTHNIVFLIWLVSFGFGWSFLVKLILCMPIWHFFHNSMVTIALLASNLHRVSYCTRC